MGLKMHQFSSNLLTEVKDICDVYLDDIIVMSREVEGEYLLVTHERDICRVLECLKKMEIGG